MQNYLIIHSEREVHYAGQARRWNDTKFHAGHPDVTQYQETLLLYDPCGPRIRIEECTRQINPDRSVKSTTVSIPVASEESARRLARELTKDLQKARRRKSKK